MRVLVFSHPVHTDGKPLVYNVSSPLDREQSYGKLFRFLDAKGVLAAIKSSSDSASEQIYSMASRGNDTHARAFLLLYQEMIGFAETDVIAGPKPQLQIVVPSPEEMKVPEAS